MPDLRVDFDVDRLRGDLVLEHLALAPESSLRTAVLLSLFLDRRALDSDTLPQDTAGAEPEVPDRRGWWGDPEDGPYGSRLWLLAREVITTDLLARARAFCLDALEWLKVEGIASEVDVEVSVPRPNWLGIEIAITRATGGSETYSYLWDAHDGGAAAAVG